MARLADARATSWCCSCVGDLVLPAGSAGEGSGVEPLRRLGAACVRWVDGPRHRLIERVGTEDGGARQDCQSEHGQHSSGRGPHPTLGRASVVLIPREIFESNHISNSNL